VDAWLQANAARRGSDVVKVREAEVRSRLAGPESWVVVAEEAGELVGMACGLPAREDDGAGDVIPGRYHLSMVFVVPDRWGQGIGGRLVDAALEHARAEGNRLLQLWTHEDNDRAQRLYLGRGFAREGRTKIDDLGEPIGLWVADL
jgi:GNAT superfamily N-acetyltransferase